MAERRLIFFQPGPSLRRVWWAQEREEADREAWLAGVQKRLGLLTRQNVDQLLDTRLGRLYG